MQVIPKHSTNHHRELHRSEYEIINEILKIVSSTNTSSNPSPKRCKPIDIVYGCCLTWHQFQMYRIQLVGLNLLNSMQSDGHMYYEITKKGLEYLRLFSELQAEMTADFPSAKT